MRFATLLLTAMLALAACSPATTAETSPSTAPSASASSVAPSFEPGAGPLTGRAIPAELLSSPPRGTGWGTGAPRLLDGVLVAPFGMGAEGTGPVIYTDGTPEHTATLLGDATVAGRNGAATIGGTGYFIALERPEDPASAPRLYATDGTTAGTRVMGNLPAGTGRTPNLVAAGDDEPEGSRQLIVAVPTPDGQTEIASLTGDALVMLETVPVANPDYLFETDGVAMLFGDDAEGIGHLYLIEEDGTVTPHALRGHFDDARGIGKANPFVTDETPNALLVTTHDDAGSYLYWIDAPSSAPLRPADLPTAPIWTTTGGMAFGAELWNGLLFTESGRSEGYAAALWWSPDPRTPAVSLFTNATAVDPSATTGVAGDLYVLTDDGIGRLERAGDAAPTLVPVAANETATRAIGLRRGPHGIYVDRTGPEFAPVPALLIDPKGAVRPVEGLPADVATRSAILIAEASAMIAYSPSQGLFGLYGTAALPLELSPALPAGEGWTIVSGADWQSGVSVTPARAFVPVTASPAAKSGWVPLEAMSGSEWREFTLLVTR